MVQNGGREHDVCSGPGSIRLITHLFSIGKDTWVWKELQVELCVPIPNPYVEDLTPSILDCDII